MECEHEAEVTEPVSPTGQYFSSSVLSVSVLAVLEFEAPIDDSQTMKQLKEIFLPINPRFSSVMVADSKGIKKWKRVEVNLKDHVKTPCFPQGLSLEFYEKYFQDYLSKIASDQLPQNRPLWEIHIIKYPTISAAGNLIFKLHHALGDGFSLIGALLSCLKRADDPSLPLTLPSRQSQSQKIGKNGTVFGRVKRAVSGVLGAVLDVGSSLWASGFLKDGRTPIRSGEDGWEFRPITVTTLEFSLDHIKQVKSKLGVTINDVITGTIFLGARLYMQSSGQGQGKAQATSLVLLSTRALGTYQTVSEMVKPRAKLPWGNYFTFLHVSIPKLTDAAAGSANPLSFVMKARRIINRKRNSPVVFLNGKMLEIMRKFTGSEKTARYIYRTLNNSSIVISNVIGPVEKMALDNQPIRGFYFAVTGTPESIAITMVSYVGKLRVAIRTGKGHIDHHKFSSCIEDAFDNISKAANQSASPANYLQT